MSLSESVMIEIHQLWWVCNCCYVCHVGSTRSFTPV